MKRKISLIWIVALITLSLTSCKSDHHSQSEKPLQISSVPETHAKNLPLGRAPATKTETLILHNPLDSEDSLVNDQDQHHGHPTVPPVSHQDSHHQEDLDQSISDEHHPEHLHDAHAKTLEDIINSEEHSPDPKVLNNLLAKTRERHFVFVDGIMNELSKLPKNYFSDYFTWMNQHGLKYTHFGYPSRNSIPDNGKKLAHDLMGLYEKDKKPITLIGHSMGGAEAVYAVLFHPRLLLDGVVDKVISIQGAILGSELATHPKPEWKVFLQGTLGAGLRSIDPRIAKLNMASIYCQFERTLKSLAEEKQMKFEDLKKSLSHRVFYIQSSHPEGEVVSLGLMAVLAFFQKNVLKEENDSLLTVDAQALPGFGRSLAVLNADHVELVIGGITAKSNPKRRQTLLKSLLRLLYVEPALSAEEHFGGTPLRCN